MDHLYFLDPDYRPALDNAIFILTLFVWLLVKSNYDFVWFCGAERHIYAKGESTQRLRYRVVTLGAFPALAGAVWMMVVADWNVGIIIRNVSIWQDLLGFMGWLMTIVVVISLLTPFILTLSYWEIYRHPAILAKKVGNYYVLTSDIRRGITSPPLIEVRKVKTNGRLHKEYMIKI